MKKAKDAVVQYQTTMTTISLPTDLIERLRQSAAWKGVDLEEAASQAVINQFYEYSREKIEKEQAIFEQLRPELLKKYRGQYVAIHNGEVVDHTADLSTLRKRVFARFGYTPILQILVTDKPLPDIQTHGLRLMQG
jgi:hypothetical protein